VPPISGWVDVHLFRGPRVAGRPVMVYVRAAHLHLYVSAPSRMNVRICRVECVWPGSGHDHSGWAGIMDANEQVAFPPLPCDHDQAAGHPLPDLPPHRRVPARQPE
jgi:hypothetical protein